MNIDSANPETFPKELELIIVEHFKNLPPEIITQIQSQKINYENDVRCAIEDYVGPFSYRSESLYQSLLSIIEKFNIICYHSTKLLDTSSIYKTGLWVNEWSTYSELLQQCFQRYNFNGKKLEKAMLLIKHQYDYKYSDGEKMLFFFSNLSLIDTEYAGYEQFCENIGGEVARWALKNVYPEAYRILKENGTGLIIKFQLPFSAISDFQKDTIIYQFVCYYAAKYFWNFRFEVEFDGMTTSNIAPHQILELIPFTREIDY